MNFQELLFTLLQAVIVAAVPVLTTFILKLITAKAAEIKQKTNNEYAQELLGSAERVITGVVSSLSQTVVDTAKKQELFDEAKAKEVFEIAKSEILNTLSDEAKKALETTYNMAIEKVIGLKIEETVRNSKK